MVATHTHALTAKSPRLNPDGANKRIKYEAADDGDPIPSNKGFMVDADGTLIYRLRSEAALDGQPLLAGVVYPFDVAELDIANSTGVAAVWILQNVI